MFKQEKCEKTVIVKQFMQWKIFSVGFTLKKKNSKIASEFELNTSN